MKDVDAVADLSEVDDRTVIENAAAYPPQAETGNADKPANWWYRSELSQEPRCALLYRIFEHDIGRAMEQE